MPRDHEIAVLALDHIGDVELGALLGVAAVPQVVGAAVGAGGDEREVCGFHGLNLAGLNGSVKADFGPADAGYVLGAQALIMPGLGLEAGGVRITPDGLRARPRRPRSRFQEPGGAGMNPTTEELLRRELKDAAKRRPVSSSPLAGKIRACDRTQQPSHSPTLKAHH